MLTYNILDKINTPYDLKLIPENKLNILSSELRSFLINTLNISGGHFASNLGIVELTIAIHYVFNAPLDNIIWDVGHQAYIHKILTGRKDKLITIKKDNGISGFPKRSESNYDIFGVGHSSTSISAALGIAIGDRLQKKNSNTIALIGDGGITGGMAFEALNHTGGIKENILIIFNDNKMSISNNVGGLSLNFNKIITHNIYKYLYKKIKQILKNIALKIKIIKTIKNQYQDKVILPNFFKDLGFYYYGPIDGHDITKLIKTLKILKNQSGPKILHVITKKGKGYKKAELNPIKYHHVAPNFHTSKKIKNNKTYKLSYSNIFGNWICQKAAQDKLLVAITPAMREGSDLTKFSQQYPDRYFDVAIAEQHAVTFAGGLACKGLKPVVAIYSTFLQRAYDQIIHDIALQNLDILYAVDRAGFVGSDGATHDGIFDISFMRCIPNHIIMTPSDENELFHMLELGYKYNGPAIVRYPRGFGNGTNITNKLDIKIGKAKIIKKGFKIAILNFGTLLPISNKLSDKYNATVIDMRFVKPIDKNILNEIFKTHKIILTLEENVIAGGAGSAVNEYFITQNINKKITIKNFGIKDKFFNHGTKDIILSKNNLSFEIISEKLNKILNNY